MLFFLQKILLAAAKKYRDGFRGYQENRAERGAEAS
jgi:hypothetical protein